MAKRITLIFILILAFLCLASCSVLLDGDIIILPPLTPATTTAVTTTAATPTLTLEPSVSAVAPVTTAPITAATPNGITVMLDAGHGENDPGAVGIFDGVEYWEKGINLAVVLKLKDELVLRGYTVLTVRDDDISLLHGWDTQAEAVARRELGVSQGADIYVSLHCNSFSGSGRAWGPIIFYNGKGSYSPARAVGVLQEHITGGFAEYKNMRACRIVDDGDYIVLKNKNMPSFLIEMGFLTDESDLSMLIDGDWQTAMARAIADGIDELYAKKYIG